MFPTFGSRARLGVTLLVPLAAAFACGERARETPETAGEIASSSAGAGAGVSGSEGGDASRAGADTSGTDDSSYAGNGSSDGECRSGQTRCHGQLGFQRCTPDDVWGPAQSCGGYSENGTSSYCIELEQGDARPWAACVDPACGWWLQSGLDPAGGVGGVCVDAKRIRRCSAGILRSTPEACAGQCRRVAELDGRTLGYCDTACEDGDRECLGGSLYRECKAGVWSTLPLRCAGGAVCQPLARSARPEIKCGGACEPFTARCAQDGASIETCDEAGDWQASPPCVLGRCVQAAAQAQCQTECRPGERACERDGAAFERVCNDHGLWGEPSACAAGATCRVGTAGALGCVACVGVDVAGGNVWGVADSRCEADGVAECSAANAYEAAAACPAGESCMELLRGAATLAYCQ